VLVANSGVFEFTLPAGIAVGDRLTTDAAGAVKVATDEDPLVGIALSAGGASGKIMILINDAQAVYTVYDDATGSNVFVLGDNVQEALDAVEDEIFDLDARLDAMDALTFVSETGSAKDIDNGTDVSLFGEKGAAYQAADKLLVTFTGTFDDRTALGTKNKGALITVQIAGGATGSLAGIGNTAEIILVDRNFFQEQSVTLQYYVASATAAEKFDVFADGSSTYESGRFRSGTLTIQELP